MRKTLVKRYRNSKSARYYDPWTVAGYGRRQGQCIDSPERTLRTRVRCASKHPPLTITGPHETLHGSMPNRNLDISPTGCLQEPLGTGGTHHDIRSVSLAGLAKHADSSQRGIFLCRTSVALCVFEVLCSNGQYLRPQRNQLYWLFPLCHLRRWLFAYPHGIALQAAGLSKNCSMQSQWLLLPASSFP